MSIGRKIRQFRNQRGEPLLDLARKAGISYSFLSAIERELKKPSVNTLKKISDALNIPVSYLLAEVPDNSLRDKLKLIREGRSLGYPELAELSGVPVETLRAFEEGADWPDLNTIEKLSDSLGVTVRYFLDSNQGSSSIGERLRKTREAKGMSVVELASKSGVSPGLVSQIERDQVVPSLRTLEQMAKNLGISVCYFLLDQQDVGDLLSTLSPEVKELLGDPRVQSILRAVRDFNQGELQYTLNQIEFFRKYRNLLK